MTEQSQKQLGKTLWSIADKLRGAMNADDFRDYMLSFLFLRYLSDNYELAALRELGPDYPSAANVEANQATTPLGAWYVRNETDVPEFEQQMRRKVHYVIKPTFAAEGLQVHRGGVLSEQLPGFVLGDQSILREAWADLCRAQWQVGLDHRQDR